MILSKKPGSLRIQTFKDKITTQHHFNDKTSIPADASPKFPKAGKRQGGNQCFQPSSLKESFSPPTTSPKLTTEEESRLSKIRRISFSGSKDDDGCRMSQVESKESMRETGKFLPIENTNSNSTVLKPSNSSPFKHISRATSIEGSGKGIRQQSKQLETNTYTSPSKANESAIQVWQLDLKEETDSEANALNSQTSLGFNLRKKNKLQQSEICRNSLSNFHYASDSDNISIDKMSSGCWETTDIQNNGKTNKKIYAQADKNQSVVPQGSMHKQKPNQKTSQPTKLPAPLSRLPSFNNKKIEQINQFVNVPESRSQSPKQTLHKCKPFSSPRLNMDLINNEEEEEGGRIGINNMANGILKLVANITNRESDKQIDRLRNRIMSQKNLKLKDYLRLTSLPRDKEKKSLPKMSQSAATITRKTSSVTPSKPSNVPKTRTAIDPQRSIALIKTSLSQKLETVLQVSLKQFQTIEQEPGLLGTEYDDLVFICNIRRIYEDNIFKTVELLEDIFREYQEKREINEMLSQRDPVTHDEVIELLSPKRKKKRAEDISLALIQKVLFGLNVIRKEEIENAQ